MQNQNDNRHLVALNSSTMSIVTDFRIVELFAHLSHVGG